MDLDISAMLFTKCFYFFNEAFIRRNIHLNDESLRWNHNHMKGAKENLDYHKASSASGEKKGGVISMLC